MRSGQAQRAGVRRRQDEAVLPVQGHAHGRERWRIPLRHEPILTVHNQKLAIVQKSARAKFDFPKRNSAARLDRINEEPGDLNHTAILSHNRALMQGYFLADLNSERRAFSAAG